MVNLRSLSDGRKFQAAEGEMPVLSRLRDNVLKSPSWKTFFATVIPIAVGLLSGTFIVEITNEGNLSWARFYQASSFYGLVAMVVITYIYNRALYKYETHVERFLDDDYCRAYMRSQCLPEAAERYKQLIRGGDRAELSNAMAEFEKILSK